MKRTALVFAVSLSTLPPMLASKKAEAALKAKWDCFLPGTPLNCPTLERSYFSSLDYLLEVPDEASADVVVRLRALPISAQAQPSNQDQPPNQAQPSASGDMQYEIDFLGAGSLPKFSIIDRVPGSLSSDNLSIRVITDLQKGTVPFSAVFGPAEPVGGGVSVVAIGDPANAVPQPPSSQGDTGWYLSPSAALSLMKSSVTSLNALGSVQSNYSDPSWRFQAFGMVSYQKITVSVPGQPDLTGEAFTYGGATVVSYTISGGWSVAAIGDAFHQPQQNEDVTAGGELGVEWTLVPFMKTNERNIAVRYCIGPQAMAFSSPNIDGDAATVFLQHGLQIYFAWHFDRVDLSVTGGVLSPVGDLSYLQASATGAVTFRLTDQFSVTATSTLSYQNKFINQPLVPDGANPLDEFLGADNFAQVQYTAMLTLNYLFGNSLINAEDQRWKTSPLTGGSG